MEIKINVSRLIENGLTESNGIILRKKIEEELERIKVDDIIILNFKNISLFATPFFNASIGYFVLKFGKEKFDKIFKLDKISELGMNTYKHSYDNAVEMYNKKIDTKQLGEVTKNNIENS